MTVETRTPHDPSEVSNKFDRELAKEAMAECLNMVIPKYLSFAECGRLTGTSTSNIKRAHSKESLLNARAFVDILKSGLKLRSTYAVMSVVENSADLHSYLSKEIGEEYTNPNYENSQNVLGLIESLKTPIAQQIYSILCTVGNVKLRPLFSIYGVDEVNKVVKSLSRAGFIIVHNMLETIELPQVVDSQNLTYNKNQMLLIIESLEAELLDSKRAHYAWHSTLATKEQEDKFYALSLKFRQELLELVAEIESTPGHLRTNLFTYVLAYANILNLNESVVGLQ